MHFIKESNGISNIDLQWPSIPKGTALTNTPRLHQSMILSLLYGNSREKIYLAWCAATYIYSAKCAFEINDLRNSSATILNSNSSSEPDPILAGNLIRSLKKNLFDQKFKHSPETLFFQFSCSKFYSFILFQIIHNSIITFNSAVLVCTEKLISWWVFFSHILNIKRKHILTVIVEKVNAYLSWLSIHFLI